MEPTQKKDHLDLTDPKILRDFLKKYGVWAKKKFGQNFLQSRESLEKIIALGNFEKGDMVVEVGPGHGVLTRELLKNGAVVKAVEIDSTILPALRGATREWKEFFEVENKHVLDFEPPHNPYIFIANIPYHLTSPILRKFLIDTAHRPKKMVILMQKEVAEKIACKTGKDSLLSTMVKTFGEPRYAFTVPASSFFPEPKVDSAVLVIDVFDTPKITIPPKIFFEMLYAGFSAPRKKLKNALQHSFLYTNAQIDPIFETLQIDKDARAQDVRIDQWEAMTKIFFAAYFENIEKKAL